jgi:hypothetical protein
VRGQTGHGELEVGRRAVHDEPGDAETIAHRRRPRVAHVGDEVDRQARQRADVVLQRAGQVPDGFEELCGEY